MCRSPNSSTNHGLADGTRSVPATFFGNVHLGNPAPQLLTSNHRTANQRVTQALQKTRRAKNTSPANSNSRDLQRDQHITSQTEVPVSEMRPQSFLDKAVTTRFRIFDDPLGVVNVLVDHVAEVGTV